LVVELKYIAAAPTPRRMVSTPTAAAREGWPLLSAAGGEGWPLLSAAGGEAAPRVPQEGQKETPSAKPVPQPLQKFSLRPLGPWSFPMTAHVAGITAEVKKPLLRFAMRIYVRRDCDCPWKTQVFAPRSFWLEAVVIQEAHTT